MSEEQDEHKESLESIPKPRQILTDPANFSRPAISPWRPPNRNQPLTQPKQLALVALLSAHSVATAARRSGVSGLHRNLVESMSSVTPSDPPARGATVRGISSPCHGKAYVGRFAKRFVSMSSVRPVAGGSSTWKNLRFTSTESSSSCGSARAKKSGWMGFLSTRRWNVTRPNSCSPNIPACTITRRSSNGLRFTNSTTVRPASSFVTKAATSGGSPGRRASASK